VADHLHDHVRLISTTAGTSAARQVDHLLGSLKPRILIFDEFHNALRGRTRDVEPVFAFLRRIGCHTTSRRS
jgi:hypothetical protein